MASTTPQRCRITSQTAARFHKANGSPNSSGGCRQISRRTAASWAPSSSRCSLGLRPRGWLTSPLAPSAANRLQISNTPVRDNPTCAAIAACQPSLAQPNHLTPPLLLSRCRQLTHVHVLHARASDDLSDPLGFRLCPADGGGASWIRFFVRCSNRGGVACRSFKTMRAGSITTLKSLATNRESYVYVRPEPADLSKIQDCHGSNSLFAGACLEQRGDAL